MLAQLLFLIPLFAIDHVAPIQLRLRIMGGRLASPGEVPYQVSLQHIATEHHFCSGVIINENYVLTVAHCMVNEDFKQISVNVGTDLQKPLSVHLIETVSVYEEFNFNDSMINDIALLKLQTPFEFSSLVSAVALPKQDQPVKADSIAVMSGFGKLSYLGKQAKRLYVVDVRTANQTYCKEMYARYQRSIHETQICANQLAMYKATCQGDSGGPVTVNRQLIGLISWSMGCGDINYPSVLTRIPSYINWISKNTI